ncbi:hypothetical protein AAF712_014774 [Marasmius tenuissimus]|uniref:F-box domain-containing protein n=1 Tax=Marasmius tenuissimus TaxID=585030 RepID=A0ABR2ZA33_9AGAR
MASNPNSMPISLSMHDSQISSIDGFPNELLERIFEEYVSDNGRIQNIARVCTRWNAIATDRPKLWSFISIDLNEVEKPSHPYRHAIAGLSIALQRSKGLALEIRFTDAQSNTRTSYLSGALMTCILEESHRWKLATLKIDPYQGAVSVLSGRASGSAYSFDRLDSFRILETLTITTIGCMHVQLLKRFSHTPSLSTLRVPTLGDIYSSQTVPHYDGQSFTTLKHLFLESSADLSLVDWLARSKDSIISCDAKRLHSFHSGGAFHPMSSDPLVLPQLVSLSLPQGYNRAIDRLMLPSLKFLKLYTNTKQPFDLSRVSELIKRSACPLEKMEIFAPTAIPLENIQTTFPDMLLIEVETEGSSGVRKVHLSLKSDTGDDQEH